MTAATHQTFDQAATPGPDGTLPVGTAWAGFGGAHGGLMIAAAARSMATVVAPDRPLRAIHADLQGAVASGVLELTPELDRAGRAVSFARVTATQGGRARLTATGVFGDGDTPVDYAPQTRAQRPDVPGVADCVAWDGDDGPALRTVEFRPATTNLPLSGSGVADFHVWIRVAGDDAPVDQARALMLLDAPAPGLFATTTAPFPVPTVELTAHLLPALAHTRTPWALARMQTVVAAEGYSVDDCELWNEDGALVALARQTRRVIAL